jgi:hypothetical protein
VNAITRDEAAALGEQLSDAPDIVPELTTEPAESMRQLAELRSLDLALGAIRAGVGGALMVAPRWAGRIWVGPGADGPGSLVFARALGARDVALGLKIVAAVRNGEPTGPWVTAGFVADGADLVASLIARRHLRGARRSLVPMVAAAVGGAGVWSARRAR